MQLGQIKKNQEEEQEQEHKEKRNHTRIEVEQSFLYIYKYVPLPLLTNELYISFVVCCFPFLCTCLTISMSPLICQ